MMLQDGLLMIREFFDCCEFFQKAGFHVVWLMRCTQDVENGYLKLLSENGRRCRWLWRSAFRPVRQRRAALLRPS